MTPYQKINFSIFSKVIYNAWPEKVFNRLLNIENVKSFYNASYKDFEKQLHSELNKYHPASWILEAYKQIELWTVIYYEIKTDQISGSIQLAPIGRYGWRYVIEVSIERLNTNFSFSSLKPTEESMNNVLTILAGMYISSEYSNYLHFLDKRLQSAQLVFSPRLFMGDPLLSESEKLFFNRIKDSISSETDWTGVEHVSPNNDLTKNKVNELLINNFSISIDEIHLIITSIINGISSITNASITVQPLDDFVDLINIISRLSKEKIISFINLAFLNYKNPQYQSRDFLRKSQQIRMLHFAGVLLTLENNYNSIYDDYSAKRPDVLSAQHHIIISPTLLAEWLDMFIIKLVLGQRTDLKQIESLKKPIADIESFYRINIFESEVKKIMEGFNFKCFNLKKVNGKDIDCGEIDIIGFSTKLNAIYIVECKALSPIIDARSLGQVVNDHYIQKKYHAKFLKKIKWIKDNLDVVKLLFQERFNIAIPSDVLINPFFVTVTDSTLDIIEDSYNIFTFYGFKNYISNELR